MLIKDIVSFCAVKNCEVNLGAPQISFTQVDESSLKLPNNYHHHCSLNELSFFSFPKKIIEKASIIKTQLEKKTKTLDRIQSKQELENFQQKVGI